MWLSKLSQTDDSNLRNTMIWKLTMIAIESGYSDIECTNSGTKWAQITKNISYYMDLTNEDDMKLIKEIPYDFKDLLDDNDLDDDEMLLFTDGSVDEHRTGGYGYHAIKKPKYKTNTKRKTNEEYIKWAERKNSDIINGHNFTSTRCSIAFCEAEAILEALRKIKTVSRPNDSQSGRNRKIRIITDSETVKGWILGTYKIRKAVEVHHSKGHQE